MNYTANILNQYDSDAERKKSFLRSLKGVLAILVILVVSTYAVSFLSGMLFSVVYEISGYSYGELYALDSVYGMFVYVCNLLIPGVFFIIVRRIGVKSCFDLSDLTGKGEKTGAATVLSYFLCAFAMSSAMSYLVSFFSNALGFDSGVFENATATTATDFVFDIISVAILPAVLEEFFFRGIFLRELLPYGKSFAITVSALFFASAHGSLEQIAYSFVYGLVFALIAVKTGSLIPGIIIHFLNNSFSCIADISGKLMTEKAFNLMFGTIIVVMVGAGLLLCAYYMGKGKFLYKDEKGALSLGEAFFALKSPAVICYLILVVAETLASYFWR